MALKKCWKQSGGYYGKIRQIQIQSNNQKVNLAKLGEGLDKSPTVMVGDNKKQQQQLVNTKTQLDFRWDQN